MATSHDKISKVFDWPILIPTTEVRQFLGLTSYYYRFMKDYVQKERPLHKLTEKNVSFSGLKNMTRSCICSFEAHPTNQLIALVLAIHD